MALTRDMHPPTPVGAGAIAWHRQTGTTPGVWNRSARKAAARQILKGYAR